MFSVYGQAGRIFRGTMEELRKVGAVSKASRSHAVAAIGRDPLDQTPTAFAQMPELAGADIAHRSALASYAQVRKSDVPRHSIMRVDDIMSRSAVTLADCLTVEDAWQVLTINHVGQAPVVTDQGVLVGLLSRADLMRPQQLPGPESQALEWRALLTQNVTQIMWTPVPSVAVDADIRRLAGVLMDTGLPGLPVTDELGQVIGFVSRSDILRAVVADPPLDLWI